MERDTLTSSSGPTEPPSRSTSGSGSGTSPTLPGMEGKPVSSSTSSATTGGSPSRANGWIAPPTDREWTDHEKEEARAYAYKLLERGLSTEGRQEFTVTLHLSTFGKPEHVRQIARSIVAEAVLRSGFVVAAYLGDEELPGDFEDSESWRYPEDDYHVTGVLPPIEPPHSHD